MRRLGACVLAAALAGCATSPSLRGTASEHAYVLLGPDGTAVVRVITAAGACPSLAVDGATVATTLRMPPATVPQRPSALPAALAKPAAFPVTTCEATLPSGAARAALGARELPLPKADPRRIVVIGDTGCRMLGPTAQACNDPARWPFERVARAAAAVVPDLVVHVGDYHYREGPCPASEPGCAASPWGYGYDTWDADLFTPGRALLAAAPWIVVRGNHEECARAGQGWWRFLDPRPLAPRRDCNRAEDDGAGNRSEPYAVPLGTSGWSAIVFDSADIGNLPLPAGDVRIADYLARMTSALALAPTASVLFTSHHPPLGFAANPREPAKPFPGNAGLLGALRTLNGEAYFPPRVQAVLSGHNHIFEAVGFASDHPPQFISGNGGDDVDEPFPVPFPAGLQPAPGTTMDMIVGSNRFGFLVMERDGAAWTLRALDVDGQPLSTCTLAQRKARCTPIASPWIKPGS